SFLDGRDAHPTITIKIVSYLIRDPKFVAYCYAVTRRLRQGILVEIAAAQGKQEESGNFKYECDRP
ncbi:hypothetical protein, partial [Microcoleus sp. D3_18a_C4]|uniref:hypothetical protein n=1 Tax=Microcoleus sp. D3_18a_C4 TaxID=3055332 RepID=UPI002FD3C4E1